MQKHWKPLVLLIEIIAENKGITHEQIAEKTGLYRSNVTRVFSLKYCPRMDIFLSLCNAVGVNFFFDDRDDPNTDLGQLFEQAMTELNRRENKTNQN